MTRHGVAGIGATGQPASSPLETPAVRTRGPNSNPAWKPDHDPYPDVTAMTISNATMTSDQNRHTARQVPDGQGWEVSWLPGQVLGRTAAITAMTLADAISEGDLRESHRPWPHIQSWAGELGLAATDAITRASGPPGKTSDQEPATGRADPQAGP